MIEMQLTAKGQALNAKIQAGDGTVPLQITRIVTASGNDPDPLNLTDVVSQQQTARIVSQTAYGIRTQIGITVSNQGNPTAGEPPLTTGYSLTQFGMFAIDPDEGEILYRITQLDQPYFMPAATVMAVTVESGWNFVVGNASEVTVTIDPSGAATIEQLDNVIAQLTDHIEQTVMSEDGVHGIRYNEGALEVWDGTEWVAVASGGGANKGQWSVNDGVLSNTVVYGTVVPNAVANTLVLNDGFATVANKVLVLL